MPLPLSVACTELFPIATVIILVQPCLAHEGALTVVHLGDKHGEVHSPRDYRSTVQNLCRGRGVSREAGVRLPSTADGDPRGRLAAPSWGRRFTAVPQGGRQHSRQPTSKKSPAAYYGYLQYNTRIRHQGKMIFP